MKPSIAILGALGALGSATVDLFRRVGFEVEPYDEPRGIGTREAVNNCGFAFVCVPTPSYPGGECDTSVVDEVVSWCEADIVVIKSTVSVGTSMRLASMYSKRVVFQPEFGPGETPDHPFRDLGSIRWLILGGHPRDTKAVVELYQSVYRSDCVIQQTTSQTAEFVKYMENCYLATKVTFCNEMYDVAEAMGISYTEARELWLLDPRMGRSHTFVHPVDRGFGGKCLPKDIAAFIEQARTLGAQPTLLEAVVAANARVRQGP